MTDHRRLLISTSRWSVLVILLTLAVLLGYGQNGTDGWRLLSTATSETNVSRGPGGVPGIPGVGVGQKININQADQATLELLPDIGPAMAGRVMAHRAISPFGRVEDLLAVRGIGERRLEKLRPYVSIDHGLTSVD